VCDTACFPSAATRPSVARSSTDPRVSGGKLWLLRLSMTGSDRIGWAHMVPLVPAVTYSHQLSGAAVATPTQGVDKSPPA
jgi:hypothetical protein